MIRIKCKSIFSTHIRPCLSNEILDLKTNNQTEKSVKYQNLVAKNKF